MDKTKTVQWMEEEFRAGLSTTGVPPRMYGGILRWILYGIAPGEFLQAVIKNDLMDALGRADDENINLLKEYGLFFYNYGPAECWGSVQKYKAWQAQGGLTHRKPVRENDEEAD